MYKNVQASPKKFLKLTQHSCCSMLTLEKNLKGKRSNSKTPTSRFLTRATKGLRSKKNSYSPI